MMVIFLLALAVEPVSNIPPGPRLAVVGLDGASVSMGREDDVHTELITMAEAMHMAVMPASEVRPALGDAIASGLRCPLWETACAARAAIALEVDAVVVVRLTTLPDGLWLRAQLTRAVGGSRRVSALLDGPRALPMAKIWEQLTSTTEPAPTWLMPVLVMGDVRVDDVQGAAPPLSTWLAPGTHVLSRGDEAAILVVPAEGERLEVQVIDVSKPPPVGPIVLGAAGVAVMAAAGTSLAIIGGGLWGGEATGAAIPVAAGGALVGGAIAATAVVWWLLAD
jgi:hypothetical protein